MNTKLFERIDAFFYYFMKLVMYLLKYLLILIILLVAGFTFLSVVNKVGLESFAGIEWDIKARKGWNVLKNFMMIICIVSLFITVLFSILSIIKDKLYLQRKKYIGRLIAFILFGPTILLPIVVVSENKKPEYRWYRMTLYFYSIFIFIQASWFLGSAFGDLLTILVSVMNTNYLGT